MISPFLFPPFIALLLSFFNKKFDANTKLVFFIILSIGAAFIYCCTTTNGGDWQFYKVAYENISFDYLPDFEIGYNYLMLLFKQLGFSFYPFFIVIKIICFSILSFRVYIFSKRFHGCFSSNAFLLLVIFYTVCPYLFIEIVRFMIALTIVSFSFNYIFKRDFVRFLLIVLFASCFHFSSILLIFVYFLLRVDLTKFIWLCILLISLLLFNEVILLNLFKYIASLFNLTILQKIITYTESAITNNSIDVFSIGNVYNMCIAIIILSISRQKLYIEKQNMLSFIMVYYIIYFITLYMGSISRVTLFLYPILFFFIFSILETLNNKIMIFLFIGLHILYSFISFYLRLSIPEYSTFSNYFIS